MNWYAIFYWLTVANNARAFFITFTVIFSAIFLVSMLIFLVARDGNDLTDQSDWAKPAKKWAWYATPFMLLFWVLTIATPSKSDTLLIIAGGAVGNFITSDTNARALPSDVMQFLRIKLQGEIATSNDELKRQLGAQTPKEKLLDKAKELTKEELIRYLETDTTLVK